MYKGFSSGGKAGTGEIYLGCGELCNYHHVSTILVLKLTNACVSIDIRIHPTILLINPLCNPPLVATIYAWFCYGAPERHIAEHYWVRSVGDMVLRSDIAGKYMMRGSTSEL